MEEGASTLAGDRNLWLAVTLLVPGTPQITSIIY